jgi:hypothetical protein
MIELEQDRASGKITVALSPRCRIIVVDGLEPHLGSGPDKVFEVFLVPPQP